MVAAPEVHQTAQRHPLKLHPLQHPRYQRRCLCRMVLRPAMPCDVCPLVPGDRSSLQAGRGV